MNQSINTDSKNSKEPQQKYRLGTVSIKILGGLNQFYGIPYFGEYSSGSSFGTLRFLFYIVVGFCPLWFIATLSILRQTLMTSLVIPPLSYTGFALSSFCDSVTLWFCHSFQMKIFATLSQELWGPYTINCRCIICSCISYANEQPFLLWKWKFISFYFSFQLSCLSKCLLCI